MAGRRGDVAQLVLSFFAQLRTSIVVLMEKAEVATGGIGSAGGASSGSSAPTGGAPDTQRINCLSEALGKQNAFDLTDLHLKEQFLQVYPPARMLVNSLAATSKLLRTVVEDVSWISNLSTRVAVVVVQLLLVIRKHFTAPHPLVFSC